MNLPAPCLPEPHLPPSRPLRPRGPRAVGSLESAFSGYSILVVEDEPRARKYLCTTLHKAGFKVLEAENGGDARDLFELRSPQVALLDIGLPGMDGFEVCQRMRMRRNDMAILMVTGRAGDSDKVSGLDLGADDYLVNPFGPDVLVARLNAVLRRCLRQEHASEVLTLGDIRVELLTMKVFKDGHAVDLTPREFTLLTTFLKHPGEVLTRDRLRSEVWGAHHFGSGKALDVFVCKLREKLEDDPSHPSRFRTEWGVGYICG